MRFYSKQLAIHAWAHAVGFYKGNCNYGITADDDTGPCEHIAGDHQEMANRVQDSAINLSTCVAIKGDVEHAAATLAISLLDFCSALGMNLEDEIDERLCYAEKHGMMIGRDTYPVPETPPGQTPRWAVGI